LLCAADALSESKQVSHSLDAIHELRLDRSALSDKPLPGRAAKELGKEWQDQT
jgi:hypothetical protein